MKFSKKIALAAIPAVMALSAAPADSKVLLMSDKGWEVSFDGAANAFYNFTSVGNVDDDGTGQAVTSRSNYGVGVIEGAGGVNSGDNGADTSSISVGLLPNVWGFTVKAPTSNGLDVSGRLGLYTHMNANGASASNNVINIRETSLTVAGSFGSVLMGRSLGIHGANAILNDVTLFGVGTYAGNISGTTLGRIGTGYVYADWYPQITWTTPGIGPIAAKIGLLQATPVYSVTANRDADDTTAPRVEAQLDYNFELGGLGGHLWLDGSYQNLGRDQTATQNMIGAVGEGSDYAEDVDIGAGSFGGKLTFEGLSFVFTGFYNKGMGIQLQGNVGNADSGSLDERGKARNFYGGYLQAAYDFGQGTNVSYSYGQNVAVRTGDDDYNAAGDANARLNYQEHHNGMIWHNVTDDFRLILEGSHTEMHWFYGGSQEAVNVSVGAFFFW
jgi:hypothetical protein